jgi:cell division protein FtsB
MHLTRAKHISIAIVLLLLAVGSVKTTLGVMNNAKRLAALEVEVRGLQMKKEALTADIDYIGTDEYLEKQARNSLSLVKPNEKVFVAPINLKLEEKDLAQNRRVLGQSVVAEPAFVVNFKSWLQLIF